MPSVFKLIMVLAFSFVMLYISTNTAQAANCGVFAESCIPGGGYYQDECSYYDQYCRVYTTAQYDQCGASVASGATGCTGISSHNYLVTKHSYNCYNFECTFDGFSCVDQGAVSGKCGVPTPTAAVPTETAVPTPTQTPTQTPTTTVSPTATAAPTSTVTPPPTATLTSSPAVTVSPSSTLTPTLTSTPAIFTSEYRCSDIKFNKNDAESSSSAWKKYQNEDLSGEPIKFKYTFTNNVTQGNNLTLFCQFKYDTGETSKVFPKSIKYIGGDPEIKSASCSYDPTGTGTQVIVKGLNFGPHSDQLEGNVKIADKESTISFWGEDTESSSSASSSAGLKNKVVAKIRDKLDEGKYAVVVTTDEGRFAKGYCTIGTTTIDFTLKTTCRGNVSGLSNNDLSVAITEKADKAKPLVKNKIKADQDGKPVDFSPKLEIGKAYSLLIRAPKTISKKVEFTAEEGTTALNDIILPVGDIYPVSSPDNVINAFDKSEMSREWNIITDVTRQADLNNDLRVNSVDYSCLLNNFNQSGN